MKLGRLIREVEFSDGVKGFIAPVDAIVAVCGSSRTGRYELRYLGASSQLLYENEYRYYVRPLSEYNAG